MYVSIKSYKNISITHLPIILLIIITKNNRIRFETIQRVLSLIKVSKRSKKDINQNSIKKNEKESLNRLNRDKLSGVHRSQTELRRDIKAV